MEHHSHKAACCEYGIYPAEISVFHLPANVASQQLVPLAHVRLEKTLREAMILERAEEKQPALSRVLHVAIQDISGNSRKNLLRLNIRLESFLQPLFDFVWSALGAEYFPIQIVFSREMAKDHRLRNSRSVGDLASGHAVEAMAAEQFGSHLENLLSSV